MDGDGDGVKVSGVTDTLKQNYLIPCPKVRMSTLNFDHSRSPDISYRSVQDVWKNVDFGHRLHRGRTRYPALHG